MSYLWRSSEIAKYAKYAGTWKRNLLFDGALRADTFTMWLTSFPVENVSGEAASSPGGSWERRDGLGGIGQKAGTSGRPAVCQVQMSWAKAIGLVAGQEITTGYEEAKRNQIEVTFTCY